MAYSTDATSARSTAVAPSFADFFGGIGHLFSLITRYREYSRAEKQLNALSTRELDDLGIARGDIQARVWANFNQR